MTFFDKLNQLCMQRGESVTSVAISLGYSRSISTTWKNTKGMPRPSTVKKLADYFGVPVSYFTDTNQAAQVPTVPEAKKEKPTVSDDELSDKRKALIELAVNASGDTLDLLLRVAQSITDANRKAD